MLLEGYRAAEFVPMSVQLRIVAAELARPVVLKPPVQAARAVRALLMQVQEISRVAPSRYADARGHLWNPRVRVHIQRSQHGI
jgi:hypothetical protein